MVSMVILNYNDWEQTSEYVDLVRTMEIIDNIVIVDNCSTDDSYEHLLPLESEKITVLKTNGNLGYAAGNNYGIRYISDRFGHQGLVIISNPDVHFEESGLNTLINVMKEDDNLFGVAGIVCDKYDVISPIFAWKLPELRMLFINSSVLLRNIAFKFFHYGTKVNKNDLDRRGRLLYCDAVPGCFFVADLGRMISIGGFCEKTFLFYEEDILFSRIKKQGWGLAIVPDVRIKHYGGSSFNKSDKSWLSRELLLQQSCIIYMQEAIGADDIVCLLYRIWNQLFLPERFFFYKLKTIMSLRK